MKVINRAILLLAGRGRRMGNLVENCPKCLLEIGGIPILKRTLAILAQYHVRDVILVVGYKADLIKQTFGISHKGIRISYVHNPLFEQTNTAYSLWLARHFLDEDCLLLEGDVVFNDDVLRRVLSYGETSSVWACIPISEGNDEGILLRCSDRGWVSGVELVRKPEDRLSEFKFKCAGIQLVITDLALQFAQKLDAAVQNGGKNLFADAILGQTMNDHSIRLCSLEGLKWAEIDDANDYYQAQRLFG